MQRTRIALAASFLCFELIVRCAALRAEDLTRLGGDLTTDLTGHNALQVAAPNTASWERFERQISGFSVFHRSYSAEEGVGPRFNNRSCAGCHVQNGKGPLNFRRRLDTGSSMVVKVSLPGLGEHGAPRDVPDLGEQLLDHSVSGRRFFRLTLRWRPVFGEYPDGAEYTLRRPILRFRVPGRRWRTLARSLRMSPILVGMGLLEAIPESTIVSLADPDDLDGDGISGEPNYVPDRRRGGFSLGRFGYRGSHPTVEQQSSAAAFNDMGLTNPLFPGPDGAPLELTEDQLSRLVLYQMIPGVPKAREQQDAQVSAGRELFAGIGCDGCHRMALATEESTEPELRHQRIHPFTDLLLHDMGPGLADTRPEFAASGAEWRTTPLWGLGFSYTVSNVRPVFLHDGRAKTVEEAILWHGGEAQQSQRRFKSLTESERQTLIRFLLSL